MHALILSDRALRMIEADCREHDGIETGGVLLGSRVGDAFVVPFVVPGGGQATRAAAGFAPDEDFQQGVLDVFFARFGADYLGDWHLHPASFDRPSGHDLRTARKILTDPAWGIEEAVFPIATMRGGRVALRAYLIRRPCPEFSEIPIEVVSDHDRRVRRLLLGPRRLPKEVIHARPHPRRSRSALGGLLERLRPPLRHRTTR